MTDNHTLLIIKAKTFRGVKDAARQRQILISDIAKNSSNHYEFRARTTNDNLLKVQRWFNEESQIIPNFGYPFGTLLFFR